MLMCIYREACGVFQHAVRGKAMRVFLKWLWCFVEVLIYVKVKV